jgi:hypothetical protein
MSSGAKKYQRLLSIHEKLRQVEAARLVKLEAALRAVKEEERRLVGILDDNEGPIAIFPELVLTRLQSAVQAAQDAEAAIAAQVDVTRRQSRRKRQAELLVERADAARPREEAARALRAILDRVALPKVSAP